MAVEVLTAKVFCNHSYGTKKLQELIRNLEWDAKSLHEDANGCFEIASTLTDMLVDGVEFNDYVSIVECEEHLQVITYDSAIAEKYAMCPRDHIDEPPMGYDQAIPTFENTTSCDMGELIRQYAETAVAFTVDLHSLLKAIGQLKSFLKQGYVIDRWDHGFVYLTLNEVRQ